MVKLIVSDLDGTLMPYGREYLSASVRERIQKALDSNITVAVSLGRTYGELASLLNEFTDRLWFVCCDGAYYVHGGKTFCERRIEPSDLACFFGLGREGMSAIFHGAFNNYSIGTVHSDARRFEPTPISRATEIKEKMTGNESLGFAIPIDGAKTVLDERIFRP